MADVSPYAGLLQAFDAITAETASLSTQVGLGPISLAVRHNETALGADVARALWPPDGLTDGCDVLCLRAGDPFVAELVPPRAADPVTLFVPERFTGQRWLLDGRNGLCSGLDLRRRRALVIWEPDAYDLLVCAPFRVLGQWLASDAGDVMLHAAAVGRAQGGVLVLGPGNAGKSTTALATVAAGGVTAGDDYVWVRGRTALSCFRTVKTRPHAPVRPREIAATLAGFDLHFDDEKKRVHYLGDRAAAMVAQMPLVGAVTLRFGAATTGWRPIPAVEAFVQTAPTSILQATGDRAPLMHQIKNLLSGLPTYELSVSPDLLEVGSAVLQLVDSLLSDPASG